MTAPVIETEHIPCPLCSEQKERVLLTGRDRLHGVEGEFTLVQCRQCALIFLNPQPTLPTLSRYYPEDTYGPHFKTSRQRNAPHKPLGYRLKRLWVRAIARIRPLDQQTRLLDVGCGNGAFLLAMQQAKGVKGTGVEFSSQVASYCRKQLGLDVRAGTLLDQEFSSHSFDVVTMFHYLEHEIFPMRVLREAKRILKEDGLLAMELPNVGSLLFKLFKGYWFPLDVPRHVVDYSPQTLKEMLRRAGFEVIALNHLPITFLVPSLTHLCGVTKRLRKLPVPLFVIALCCLYFLFWPLELICGIGLRFLGAADMMTVYARPVRRR
jgi:SAM-dependent methyltransferase